MPKKAIETSSTQVTNKQRKLDNRIAYKSTYHNNKWMKHGYMPVKKGFR
jgi:hypothetical protein